jgi:glycosyltransferase involved in cell wall biosynthesis
MVARPLVSIVTPSYNQAEYLGETMQSVLDQNYEPLEYVVIDGGSVDASVEIVRRYEHRLAFWASEADSGQAEALNRGFARSDGDYLGWLCSDDTLLPGAIATMVDFLERRPDVDLVYGDVFWADRTSRRTHYAASREWDADEVVRGGSLPLYQPSSLWRRWLWEVAGPFDEDLHYLFDTAFFHRIACIGTAARLPRPLATYRVHERSKSGRTDEAKIAEYKSFGRRSSSGEPFELLDRHARDRRAAFERRAAWMLAKTGRLNDALRLFSQSLAVSPRMSRRTALRFAGMFTASRGASIARRLRRAGRRARPS